MKVGLLEVLTFAFVTATVTVCMLNGLWPGHYSSCMAPDPYAGLPEELIANCTGW